jgi:carbamoyl-phosphate synthase/aspartate carbamoyltransferase
MVEVALELQDGFVCRGISFGAEKAASGELVFQTGMVGYPESLTDPSYRGQILVITFPLVGNYGVPSRTEMDKLLPDIPAYFESSEIHIAGLIVSSYAGEEYSHYLATSSLGTWLKEQDVPAIYGIDTRALTKRIREHGSMLGRLLLPKPSKGVNGLVNGIANALQITGPATNGIANGADAEHWRSEFEIIPWYNPNDKNLVAEGDLATLSILATPCF